MPEIVLPADATHVRVEEIPGFLALAIHPEQAAGRVVSYLTKHGPSFPEGLPLTTADETTLSQIWLALPPWQSAINEAEWPRYANAFDAARSKPKWVPLPVWRNAELDAAILRHDAETLHRRALREAIQRGELAAANHALLRSSGAPRDLVAADAFRAYAAQFGVVVRIATSAAESASAEPVPGAAQATVTPAAALPGAVPVPVAETTAHAWSLNKPQRDDGLAGLIFGVLKEARQRNAGRPTARNVLAAFRESKPLGIVRVLADGCDYLDGLGNEESANLEGIRKRISAMTAAQAPRKSRNRRAARATVTGEEL